MKQHLSHAGGPTVVRRLVAYGLMMGAMTLAFDHAGAAGDPEPHATVTVREERGVYSVTAVFQVPQRRELALAVLTDYERIPRFMPGVETSVVLERTPGRAVIAQDAVSRVMMFRKRVHLVLEILEAPDTLQFRDRSGDSFARYEGSWRLCDVGGGTAVTYRLTAQPAFDVPEFLLKRLLKRDSGQMIDGLRREIEARAGRHGAGA